jgi:hypothetical protein
MPDLIRHPEASHPIKYCIPGQARNDDSVMGIIFSMQRKKDPIFQYYIIPIVSKVNKFPYYIFDGRIQFFVEIDFENYLNKIITH